MSGRKGFLVVATSLFAAAAIVSCQSFCWSPPPPKTVTQHFTTPPRNPQEAKAPYKFEAKADRPDAVYKVGETAKFEVMLLDADGKPLDGAKFSYYLKGDFGVSARGEGVSSASKPFVVEAKLEKPGFALLSLDYRPKDSKTPIRGLVGAAFDPLQIKERRPEPADFDAFWDKAKAELAAVPMKSTEEPVKLDDNLKDKVECFDVKIDCAGGAPVSGYLAKPVGAKPRSLPAIISYHGAGVRSSGKPLGWATQGFLAMDVNAHGLENGKPAEFYDALAKGALKDYRTRDSNDPSRIYFRGMFLRVLRALEYLKSQPEWDGENLVVVGTSQGGGQALVAAGLDHQVSFCQANVPALCFHSGILDGQENGWPRFISMKDGKPVDPAVVATVPYYDAANFAKRIECPAILSTGFIDTTCPPTSVYAAFNNIPNSDKTIVDDLPCGHGVPKETYDLCAKEVKARVGKK